MDDSTSTPVADMPASDAVPVAVLPADAVLNLALPPPPSDDTQLAAYDPGILMLLGVIQASDRKHDGRQVKQDEQIANLRADVKKEVDGVHELTKSKMKLSNLVPRQRGLFRKSLS